MLSNAKKLRANSSTFQKVYVTPDLSLNERQENKRLRDELLQHKKDGPHLYCSRRKRFGSCI